MDGNKKIAFCYSHEPAFRHTHTFQVNPGVLDIECNNTFGSSDSQYVSDRNPEPGTPSKALSELDPDFPKRMSGTFDRPVSTFISTDEGRNRLGCSNQAVDWILRRVASFSPPHGWLSEYRSHSIWEFLFSWERQLLRNEVICESYAVTNCCQMRKAILSGHRVTAEFRPYYPQFRFVPDAHLRVETARIIQRVDWFLILSVIFLRSGVQL